MNRFAAARRRVVVATVAVVASLPVVAVGTTVLGPGRARAATVTAQVVMSSSDGSLQLSPQPDVPFTAPDGTSAAETVTVTPGNRHQTMAGFGGSMESTSVWNFVHMSPAHRAAALSALYDPATGNGFDLVRLPIGCADMCAQPFYTFDDVPAGQTDPSLASFSIQKDIDSGIIAVARQILQINPDVRFFMSMWSAPAWMKSNGSLTNGGSVLPQWYDALARYQVKAVQAYQAQGVPIYAMTPQNEPGVVQAYPTGTWTGAQMASFIGGSLGPALRDAGLSTQLWINDDNTTQLDAIAVPVLTDATAAPYVSAVAFHDYAGQDPSVLAAFHSRFPSYPLYLTERSYYDVDGISGHGDPGMNRLLQWFRNGASSWSYWITFLDRNGQPNTGPLDASCCPSQVMSPAGQPDAATLTRDYSMYGQVTRFVRRGAVLVDSTQGSGAITNAAFVNPDGGTAVVLVNTASSAQTMKLLSPQGQLVQVLPPRVVATVAWGGTAQSIQGTYSLVNVGQTDSALHATFEEYGTHAAARNVVASPAGWAAVEQQWTVAPDVQGGSTLTDGAHGLLLQETNDPYGGSATVHHAAATPGTWNLPTQHWRLQSAGGNRYRVVNAATGNVLQATYENYGGYTNVWNTAVAPWIARDEQLWVLVRVSP